VTGSGREVWRKKKIPRKRERREGTASCTGGQRRKGWESEWCRERKAEKAARGSRAQGQQEEKGKGQGAGQREKTSSGDTGKDTERAGHRKIDQDSGRMEMEKNLWMVNRTKRNRNTGRELDKGIE